MAYRIEAILCHQKSSSGLNYLFHAASDSSLQLKLYLAYLNFVIIELSCDKDIQGPMQGKAGRILLTKGA